jgi:hypothetical protein
MHVRTLIPVRVYPRRAVGSGEEITVSHRLSAYKAADEAAAADSAPGHRSGVAAAPDFIYLEFVKDFSAG